MLTLREHLGSPAVFRGVPDARSVVFCVLFCRSLFFLYVLDIGLLVLRFMDSDDPIGIFKQVYNFFMFIFSFILLDTIDEF